MATISITNSSASLSGKTLLTEEDAVSFLTLGAPGLAASPNLTFAGFTSTGLYYDSTSGFGPSVSNAGVRVASFGLALGKAILRLAGFGITMSGEALGAGATGQRVTIGRNSSGGGAPGHIELVDKAGTSYYLWVDTTGDLRINTSAPVEGGSDVGGSVVGSQS